MKFALFTTGGTIASVPSDHGLLPGLSGEELLGLCRRVLVLRSGASAGFVEEEVLDERHIIRKATGVEA